MRICVIGEEDRKKNIQMIGKARELAEKGEDEIILIFVVAKKAESESQNTYVNTYRNEYMKKYRKDYLVDQTILLYVEEEEFGHYRSHICINMLKEFLVEIGAGLVLFSSTFMWREVAAALTVLLDGALLTDCIDLKREENELVGVRPSLDGKSLSFYRFLGKFPYFCLIKEGGVGEEEEMSDCSHTKEETEVSDYSHAREETELPYYYARKERKEICKQILDVAKLTYIETIQKKEQLVHLKDAQMIVAGGRGMLNQDSFLELRRLAKAYGASVGASRPIVDQGWAKMEEQVGQTGSFVKPKVYLAFGISGAVQHLAGMKDSQVIIAVNQNRNSPIFRYCDYGIIADANSIIRNMIQILEG